MSRGFVQHPDGGLFLIEQDAHRVITAIFGPVSMNEAARYADPEYRLSGTPEEIAWARTQHWLAPDASRGKQSRSPSSRKRMAHPFAA